MLNPSIPERGAGDRVAAIGRVGHAVRSILITGNRTFQRFPEDVADQIEAAILISKYCSLVSVAHVFVQVSPHYKG